MEATQFKRTMRTSFEGRRTWAIPFSLAISCAAVPAARTSCPPLPGYSSMLWMKVPTGMFVIGRQFPGLMSAPALLKNVVADV